MSDFYEKYTAADALITPFFKWHDMQDDVATEIKGERVSSLRQVVEIRIAGDDKYSPIFPVEAMSARNGHRVVTYAERWANQYAAFLEGDSQISEGTPLEKLIEYGITPEQLSLCRALKIYSIEGLYQLDGPNLRRLSMNATPLKEMAKRFMSNMSSGSQALSEIERLRAEIEALKAGAKPVSTTVPVEEAAPVEVEKAIEVADGLAKLQGMTEDELRDFLTEQTGTRPRGNPSHSTLVNLAKNYI